MKFKTCYGTVVEIKQLLGNNHVIVDVVGRKSIAQIDASDLILPENCKLPEELSELKFFNSPKKE